MLRGWIGAAVVVGLLAGCGSDRSRASRTATSETTPATSTSASTTVTKADFAKGRDYWYGLDEDQRGRALSLCKAAAGAAAAGLDRDVLGRALDEEFSTNPRSTLQEACIA